MQAIPSDSSDCLPHIQSTMSAKTWSYILNKTGVGELIIICYVELMICRQLFVSYVQTMAMFMPPKVIAGTYASCMHDTDDTCTYSMQQTSATALMCGILGCLQLHHAQYEVTRGSTIEMQRFHGTDS